MKKVVSLLNKSNELSSIPIGIKVKYVGQQITCEICKSTYILKFFVQQPVPSRKDIFLLKIS